MQKKEKPMGAALLPVDRELPSMKFFRIGRLSSTCTDVVAFFSFRPFAAGFVGVSEICVTDASPLFSLSTSEGRRYEHELPDAFVHPGEHHPAAHARSD
jgi:hypothetical protein